MLVQIRPMSLIGFLKPRASWCGRYWKRLPRNRECARGLLCFPLIACTKSELISYPSDRALRALMVQKRSFESHFSKGESRYQKFTFFFVRIFTFY
jgi:hypothetical protein